MNKNKRARLYSALIGASSLIAMWLVWVIAHKTVKNEYLVPGVKETLSSLLELLKDGFFWRATYKTLIKVIIAFAISFVLAGALSALGNLFKRFDLFLKPITAVIRTLPTMAILVLILIYTNATTAPVIVAVLVLMPMIYNQFSVAFRAVDDGLVSAMKIYGVKRKDRIFKVYLPVIAPTVLGSVGSNLSFGVKLIISAEVMAFTFTSIGGMMQNANAMLDIPKLSALTLVAVILGLLIELIFHLALKKAFKWNESGVNV